MSDIKKIKDEYLNKLDSDLNIESVNQIKTELFGKNGKISNSFKNLGSLLTDERKKFASDLNSIKNELQDKIDSKLQEIETKEINSKLENEKVDVTLPEREFSQGKIHPVSQVIDEISSICFFKFILNCFLYSLLETSSSPSSIDLRLFFIVNLLSINNLPAYFSR